MRRPPRGLAALVAGGLLVRGWFMVSARPGFLGYPDAVTYVIAAKEELFWSPYRPAGYPLVLRGLRAVHPRLAVAIGAQHALGVATALMLHAVTARFVRRKELALLPAGVVLLGGTQVALERPGAALVDNPVREVARAHVAARLPPGGGQQRGTLVAEGRVECTACPGSWPSGEPTCRSAVAVVTARSAPGRA